MSSLYWFFKKVSLLYCIPKQTFVQENTLDVKTESHSLFSRLRKNLGSGVGTSVSLRLGWGEVLLLPPPPSALFSPPEVLRVERLRECVLSESGFVQRRRFGVVAGITGETEVSVWAEWPSVDWGVDGFRPGLGERSPRDLKHKSQFKGRFRSEALFIFTPNELSKLL